jgi:hypothetical protein
MNIVMTVRRGKASDFRGARNKIVIRKLPAQDGKLYWFTKEPPRYNGYWLECIPLPEPHDSFLGAMETASKIIAERAGERQ